MDPNANLQEQLRIVKRLLHESTIADDPEVLGVRLAELVEALDEWIRMGGAFPKSWWEERVGKPAVRK